MRIIFAHARMEIWADITMFSKFVLMWLHNPRVIFQIPKNIQCLIVPTSFGEKKNWCLIQAFTADKTSSPFLPMVCGYLLPLQEVICFLLTLTLINPAPTLSLFFQFSSVAQSCPTLCDPMNRSTPGLPVHHKLSEFTQTHAHRVSDAIQPSHPLSFPSPPAPNPSQHQGLFQWVNSSTLHMRWP